VTDPELLDGALPDGDDTADPQTVAEMSDAAFVRLLEKLSSEYGFDFREYKRASLVRRIRTRMQQLRVPDFGRYIEYLDRHQGEHVELFNTILINVTTFFRDPQAWRVLAEEALPRLLHGPSESRSLRVWSVGCSSGEEAYSIAILLAEQLGERARTFNVKIYATDVDEEALVAARHGVYRVEDVKDVPTPLLERYFVRDGQTFRFRRDFRRWVIFGRHNVVQDPPLSHVDLLICRNVLIYFTGDLQDKILARFHYAIREGGFLFLGRSESLLARSRWFTPLNVKWRIFHRTNAPAPTVPTAMPGGDYENATTAAAARSEAIDAATRLQRVVEALPDALMVIDAQDTILVWNAAAEALYDSPGEAALNRKFRDLDISYRIEGLRARVEEVKSKHIPARLENVNFLRRSGEIVHADLTVLPLFEGPRVVAVIVCGSDATDQARLKDQMTRVSEQHATAIEELQATNEELETTNEELQSTNEELETTVEELQAANSELATVNAELERRTGEMNRLEAYQRAVLASLESAVLVTDREAIVTTWNQTAERMWGLGSEHVIGRSLWMLPIGEMTRLTRQPLTRVLETGQPEIVRNIPFVLPNGEQHRAVLRLSVLRDPAGVITGVVGVALPDDEPRT
jgi:two-component system CheB/CheR fusion protein